MTEEGKEILSIYKEEFENYKNFLDLNYWFDDVKFNKSKNKLESSKLQTEVSIISTIIKGIEKFKEDIKDDINSKKTTDFLKFTSDIIERHINTIAEYKKLFPIHVNSSESDVEFHSDLFALITKTKISLSKLNINESDKKDKDIFFGNARAPLVMREQLCSEIPIVKDMTDLLGINFNSPTINPSTSNELLINMKEKDIPPYNPKKHFFDQEVSTIQFWEEEFNKIKNGVNIGGYHISNWLYWHINIFKLAYGKGKDKSIKIAEFRDNEYFFDHMYNKAESDEYGRHAVFSYGSRRFAKSVGMTSRLLHGLWTINNAQGTVQGFSKIPDLLAIIDYSSDAILNMFPALRVNANSIDIDRGISLGIKGKKAQDIYKFGELTVVNLEGGTTKRGSQKAAAFTPDIFLLDEAGKGKCIPIWKAAMPSFAGGENGKWRLVPLISGTAGEGELSVDAELMLKNPEMYSILPMDWDFLEEFIDPEFVTWKRNNFGFFVPAQMSLEAPDKIKKPFGDFLKSGNIILDDETHLELNNIDIHVTDWETSMSFFNKKREKLSKDITLLSGEINSFPLDPEDCYATTEVNIFPGQECKRRKSIISENGMNGQKYRIHSLNGEIFAEMSPNDKVITEYPYKGTSIDCPVILMENPLLSDSKPPLGLYVIGFDDVKHDKTDGDSVMSTTIFKRGYEGGEWANRIVGTYDSRPERKKDYYRVLYLLIKMFNARFLHENADNGFIEYLEENHPEDLYTHVSAGVGLASEDNLHRNNNRKWGWHPTDHNIYHLNQKIVRYTKEEGVVIGEEQGLSGVDRINAEMLLEELYRYKKGKNADRIRSFGLALTLASYYDRTYQYIKNRKKTTTENKKDKQDRYKTYKGLTSTRGFKKY